MMTRLAFAVASVAMIACVATAHPPSGYYISRPTRTVVADSVMVRVVLFVDERTMIWRNATLERDRDDLLESGECFHIAARLGTDGFKVDSVFPGTLDHSKPSPTWHSIWFSCPDGSAPVHTHIVTAALKPWLDARRDTIAYPHRCEPSEYDTAPVWAKYAFNAMQCGQGIDSLIAYRVKAR